MLGVASSFFLLSSLTDHMTGKRSVKEVDKTSTAQLPLLSGTDAIAPKSQGEESHKVTARKEVQPEESQSFSGKMGRS